MFHVGAGSKTLEQVISAVGARYSHSPEVVQVIAVPMFEEFPTYDFFLLLQRDTPASSLPMPESH